MSLTYRYRGFEMKVSAKEKEAVVYWRLLQFFCAAVTRTQGLAEKPAHFV